MKILIINSQGHWINGWMTSPKSVEIVTQTLQKLGYQVDVKEVKSIVELTELLRTTSPKTIVWTNAYWVNGNNGEQQAIAKLVEEHNLPILGSNLNALMMLLEKDTCQKVLEQASVPIPAYHIVDNENIKGWLNTFRDTNNTYPLIVKPTKESRSQGVVMVNSELDLFKTIQELQQRFPDSSIIVEEFLPNSDITCGYLKLGNEIMLLPSYNVVEGVDCSKGIISEEFYSNHAAYSQMLINDDNILNQLKEYTPVIANALGISTVTRMDARLDPNGILKFFDINGMPGLNYPASALIKQCSLHFPQYSEDDLFECLINTIVLENIERYGLEASPILKERNLFALESTTAIRLVMKEEIKESAIDYSL